MSPSEFDLRAALRDGEGDGIDAGPLIADANRIRRDRRRRINAGLGVAAAVGVLGTFGVLIGTSGSGEEAGGGSAVSASGKSSPGDYARVRSAGGAPVAGGAMSAQATAQPSAPRHGNVNATPTCPSRPEHVKRPGGDSPTQGSLFPGGVSSISACAYPASGSTVFGAIVSGTAARSLARSLDSAPDGPGDAAGPCLAPFNGKGSLQLRVYDSNGTMVAPLTVVPSCRYAAVSNGTVTKYPRHLPAPLPGLLRAVR